MCLLTNKMSRKCFIDYHLDPGQDYYNNDTRTVVKNMKAKAKTNRLIDYIGTTR